MRLETIGSGGFQVYRAPADSNADAVVFLERIINLFEKLAARLGLEPRQNESESFVLPLHHRAKIERVSLLVAASGAPPFNQPSCARTKSGREGRSDRRCEGWSRRWDSNPQPPVYKTGALPLSYAGKPIARLPSLTGKKHHTRLGLSSCVSLLLAQALITSLNYHRNQTFRLQNNLGWWLPGDSNPEPID
jgi:hypothetical protein